MSFLAVGIVITIVMSAMIGFEVMPYPEGLGPQPAVTEPSVTEPAATSEPADAEEH